MVLGHCHSCDNYHGSFIFRRDEENVTKDIITDPYNLNFVTVVTSAIVHVYTVQKAFVLTGQFHNVLFPRAFLHMLKLEGRCIRQR